MNLRRLAFMSTASHPMGDNELHVLLKNCRQTNSRLRVSGYLHYHQGEFIQVLEGPDHAVGECLDRIKRDPRHHDIRLLFDERVHRRTFANWSMGITCASAMTPSLFKRIQSGIDKLRSADNIMSTQVLMLFDQLMLSGPLVEAA